MNAVPPVMMSKLAQRSIRISVALALTGVLILIRAGQASGHVGSGNIFQYECDGRCFGTTSWTTTSQYFGAYSDILIVPFQCTQPACTGDDSLGFIDNEIWLIDDTSRDCKSNPNYKMCWVEAGYKMDHNSPDEVFFMKDDRPNSNPFEILLGPVGPAPSPTPVSSPTLIFGPAIDAAATPVDTATPVASPTGVAGDYGHKDHFMIIRDARTTPVSFQIFMYNDNLSNLYGGTSSSNSMAADRITIGQELHGTGGAAAGQATFSRNIFAVQSLDAQNNGFFIYDVQKDRGMEIHDDPLMEKWEPDPASAGNDAEGGVFKTQCC